AFGPRVVPGTYSVKMTKGDKVYTAPLNVVLDPHAQFTIEDRKAQFNLATRLSEMLNHMSWAVAAIIDVRDAASQRAAGLQQNDPLRQQVQSLGASADSLRKKIVTIKEGGAVTGEERLREFLGGLYGDVNGYEGRPTDSQITRSNVLARELEDVIHEFTNFTNQQLPVINRQLQAKKTGSDPGALGAGLAEVTCGWDPRRGLNGFINPPGRLKQMPPWNGTLIQRYVFQHIIPVLLGQLPAALLLAVVRGLVGVERTDDLRFTLARFLQRGPVAPHHDHFVVPGRAFGV